jgi:glycopeptide antibiotics resistance protein
METGVKLLFPEARGGLTAKEQRQFSMASFFVFFAFMFYIFLLLRLTQTCLCTNLDLLMGYLPTQSV